MINMTIYILSDIESDIMQMNIIAYFLPQCSEAKKANLRVSKRENIKNIRSLFNLTIALVYLIEKTLN